MNTTDKIMALADEYADTSFTQGLEQRTEDPIPEQKRQALHAQIEALVRERDEADRRAGAAERHTSGLADDLQRMYRVRDEMKDQWGVSRQVSFDVVWAEALALKTAMQEKQS